MVRDADQVLVNLIVHLLEIQHHQVCYLQQLVDNRIVATYEAVGIQAGVDAFFLTRAEPVANKLRLQDRLTARGGDAAAGSIHKVTIGHHLFH